jgi:uncharacterized small protein (DUF1192 family)
MSPVPDGSRPPPHLDLLMERRDMSKEKEIVRIDLTKTQKEVVKKETGKDAEAIELTVSELEERIAPIVSW